MSRDRGRVLAVWTGLVLAGTWNGLLRRARKVRDPRYAVALGVGLLYFGWLVFGFWLDVAREPTGLARELEVAAPLGLAVLVGWWWLRGGYESALAFSPAEVALLFPAPVTRPDLLHLKLLRSLGALALTALFGALFLRAGALPFGLDFVSFLLLVATLHLHQLGSSLVRAGAVAHGRAALRRTWIPGVLLGLVAVALVWSLGSALEALRTAGDVETAVAAVAAALAEPVPRTVLMPFRWVLAPTMAGGPAEWLRALPAALAVLAAHYLWVVRSDAAFEEAAAEAGRRRMEKREAMRGGRLRLFARQRAHARTTGLPLAARGAAWRAVVWKSAVGIVRDYPLRIVLPGLPALVVAAALVFAHLAESPADGVDVTIGLVGVVVVLLALFGPIAFRRDLRADLEHLELLRTLPIAAPALALGALVSSTLFLAAVQGLLLAGALVLLPWSHELAGLGPWLLPGLLATALLLVPTEGLLLAAQNLLALLLPGWTRAGTGADDGVELLGRQLVTLLLALLVDALALALPLVLGVGAGLGLLHLLGPWAVLAGALVAWVAIVAEAALAVLAMGALWERVDPVEAGAL